MGKKKSKKGKSGAKRGEKAAQKAALAACVARQNAKLAKVGLTLRQDPDRGRCLVALRPFKQGELVLQTTSFAQTLMWGWNSERCANCFQRYEVAAEKAQIEEAVSEVYEACGHDAEGFGKNPKVPRPTHCRHCKVARYCSSNCQQAHWQRSHKWTCSSVLALEATSEIKRELKAELLTLAECIARVSTDKAKAAAAAPPSSARTSTAENPNGGGDVARAEEHPSRLQEVRPTCNDFLHMHSLDTQKQQITAMVNFGIEHGVLKAEDRSRAIKMLKSFSCNNFGVQDDIMLNVAIGVYPIGALLNHSCLPNTIVTYLFEKTQDGIVQRFHATEDIEIGEEITHCFTDVCSTIQSRRAEFLRDYGFRCDCKRCTSEEWVAFDRTLSALNPRLYSAAPGNDKGCVTIATARLTSAERRTLKGELHQAEFLHYEAIRSYNPALERRHLQQALAIRCQHLHPQHLDVLNSFIALHSVCMAQHDFRTAAKVMEDILARTVKFHGQFHPMRILRLRTLADLKLMQQRDVEYYELQREALRAMTVSFGADHPVVQSLAVTSTRRPGYEKFDQQRGATDDGDGVDKWASLGPEKQEEVMTAFASALSRGGK